MALPILKNKCPYCFYKLAEDGFCARVCKMGALKRKQHELETKTQEEESVVSTETEATTTEQTNENVE